MREAGADLIDINMGCPVQEGRARPVRGLAAGRPGQAVAIARARDRGQRAAGDGEAALGPHAGRPRGLEVARRLVEDAGVSAIALHPRHASQQHKGKPDYDTGRSTGPNAAGARIAHRRSVNAEKAREAYEHTGAAAVLLARGALGNPWIFEELLGLREEDPSVEEIASELNWVIDSAEEHFGVERAGRWLLERPIRGTENASRYPRS